MNEQIIPSRDYTGIINNPLVLEYINLAFQFAPIANNAIGLARQLETEETTRLEIREFYEKERRSVERRMNQLDAELEADFTNNKTIIDGTMRAFEKMINEGHIEQAMILHERIINKLSTRASIAAEKFNQNNSGGQARFYTN
jgi:hypothetical protein